MTFSAFRKRFSYDVLTKWQENNEHRERDEGKRQRLYSKRRIMKPQHGCRSARITCCTHFPRFIQKVESYSPSLHSTPAYFESKCTHYITQLLQYLQIIHKRRYHTSATRSLLHSMINLGTDWRQRRDQSWLRPARPTTAHLTHLAGKYFPITTQKYFKNT